MKLAMEMKRKIEREKEFIPKNNLPILEPNAYQDEPIIEQVTDTGWIPLHRPVTATTEQKHPPLIGLGACQPFSSSQPRPQRPHQSHDMMVPFQVVSFRNKIEI